MFETQPYVLDKNPDLSYLLPTQRDQMSASSCTGFTEAQVVEADVFRLTGERIKFSPLANYYGSRLLLGTQDVDNGSFVRFALQAGEKGNVPESAWSSTDMSHVNTAPPDSALALGSRVKIIGWEQLKLDPDSYASRQHTIQGAIAAGYIVLPEEPVTEKMMHETRALAQQVFNNPNLDSVHQYDVAANHAAPLVKVFEGNTVTKNQWVFSDGTVWGDNGLGIWNSTHSSDKAYIVTAIEIDGKQYDMSYTPEKVAICQLYISLFNRAPEAGGLAFWADALKKGAPMESVVNAMACCAPALSLYPTSATEEQLVKTFYHNVLGREVDADSSAFWVSEVQHKGFGVAVLEAISIVMAYAGSNVAGIESQKGFMNDLAVAMYANTQCAIDDVKVCADIIHNTTSDIATVGIVEASLIGLLHPSLNEAYYV